ncbi:MAG TPA: superinfection immunity protein [Dehalococcoidia bacterium]|nr:superinfection immunity protein [Dehalococcoidia bacterium]
MLVFLLLLALYFLPTIIALVAKKRNTLAIFLLNFFLGWSFFGWVVALVWSATKD